MGTLHLWGERYWTEDPEKSYQLVPYIHGRTENGTYKEGQAQVMASRIPVWLYTSSALASACGHLAETHAQSCPQRGNGAGCLGFRNARLSLRLLMDVQLTRLWLCGQLNWNGKSVWKLGPFKL